MKRNSKTRKNQVQVPEEWNVLSNEERQRRITELTRDLTASTWKTLETGGKFSKNDKLSFITDDMLIVGCDVGSTTHYMRAIDTRGRELSDKAFSFDNNAEGFKKAKDWMVELAAKHGKKQIVMGLEPTGHYWFCLAAAMINAGITVVQVNPYAVKQTKELEDNSQLKDDRKDPKPIANLVKDGNFGMPYIPEGIYADIRKLVFFRDQLNEEKITAMNRLHRELAIHFPEYKDALGDIDGAFNLVLLQNAPLPEDMAKLSVDEMKQIWKDAGLRGRGFSKAKDIISYAKATVGLREGADGARESIPYFAERIYTLSEKLKDIEQKLEAKVMEIPNAEKVLEIEGVGPNILAGIIGEMGDITRFDDVKEIQKISGLGLVACSSGKHQGQTKISHRGRKRLRYYLFLGSKSVVSHSGEFKKIHAYYTTRVNNPLKKMQSLIAVSCKLLRVIYIILKTGCSYDPEKMMKDIRLPESGAQAVQAQGQA